MIEAPGIDVITILKITQTSENFLKLDYISTKQGLAYGLLRQSKSKKYSARIDLFDTAEILNEVANHSKQIFVKNYTIIQKRSAIGNNYKQLEYACHFATFILDNVSDVPDPYDLYALTTQTLDAFEQKLRPEIISLKALYRFLKTEGWPVESKWWQSLTKENKSHAKILLTTPLGEFKDSFDSQSAIILHKLLCQWAQRETELKIKPI